MPIHAVLRERRRAVGLTQEQVAQSLGVSAPAVHKWEKGATYPDVDLLPALARLLSIDLNTLFSFEQELSHTEIGLLLNRVTALCRAEGFEAAFSLAMDKVREYPRSAELLHSLALVLQGSLMMAAELPPERKSACDTQITALYERVAACGDPNLSSKARYMLASRLIAAGHNDQAQAALDALPEYNSLDKRRLQAQLWNKEGRYKEAAQLLEHMLLAELQNAQTSLGSLVNIAVQEGDGENAAHLAQCGQRQAELFGLWGYAALVVPFEAAVARRDTEESLLLLDALLSALLTPWDMAQSPICRHIQPKPAEGNFGVQFLPSVLTELEHSPGYAFLHGEPAYQALLQRYRAIAQKEAMPK